MSAVQLWDIAQITVTDEKLKACFYNICCIATLQLLDCIRIHPVV